MCTCNTCVLYYRGPSGIRSAQTVAGLVGGGNARLGRKTCSPREYHPGAHCVRTRVDRDNVCSDGRTESGARHLRNAIGYTLTPRHPRMRERDAFDRKPSMIAVRQKRRARGIIFGSALRW